MSEVVAKYMGKIVYRFEGITWITDDDKCDVPIERWFDSHFTWDWIHEVWEKFKNQKIPLTQENIIDFRFHRIGIETCIIDNLLLETFTALYNAIEFINKLKQENNVAKMSDL